MMPRDGTLAGGRCQAKSIVLHVISYHYWSMRTAVLRSSSKPVSHVYRRQRATPLPCRPAESGH
jgi:hypothetical protein